MQPNSSTSSSRDSIKSRIISIIPIAALFAIVGYFFEIDSTNLIKIEIESILWHFKMMRPFVKSYHRTYHDHTDRKNGLNDSFYLSEPNTPERASEKIQSAIEAVAKRNTAENTAKLKTKSCNNEGRTDEKDSEAKQMIDKECIRRTKENTEHGDAEAKLQRDEKQKP